MLFWALLTANQITVRKVDGWQTLDQPHADQRIDLAVCSNIPTQSETELNQGVKFGLFRF
jgi:hypothetical protein